MSNNDWVEDYLMHHGILGQKWGVRRYQNKDGSLTSKGQARYSKVHPSRGDYTLQKGTQFQRISSKKNETQKGRMKWATYDKDDSELYKNFIPDRHSKERYAHTLEAKKDLKVASSDTFRNTMMDVIGDKTVNELKEHNIYYQTYLNRNDKASKAFIKRYGDKTVEETRNDLYNHALRSPEMKRVNLWIEKTFAANLNVSDTDPYVKSFIKLLKERGYDAIEDEWSRAFDNTKHAIIILDPEIATKKIKVERLQDNYYYEPEEEDY